MNESIKKGIGTLALATIAMILLSGMGSAAANLGDVIGTYVASDAKSNGPCVAKYSGIYEGKDCGITSNRPWQCTEYVKRFYRDSLKVENQWSGDAGTYYGSASAKGLLSFPNGGSERPKPNDILAFSGGKYPYYGHVAIITEVTDTYVNVIEQNWNRNDAMGPPNHQIPYNKVANRIGDVNGNRGNYHIQGWLRKEAIIVTSPNGAEVWSRFSPQTVKWKYYGNPGSSVVIELVKGSSVYRVSPFTTISMGNNGVGSYSFVPGNVPTGYGYKVRVTSTKIYQKSSLFYMDKDMSDNYFYIQ